MLAYLLNRLRMPSWWRNFAFVVAASFEVLSFTLGFNYSLGRFLTPFFALLLVLAIARRGPVSAALAAVAGVVVGFAVSPEMGVATTAGLLIAFVAAAIGGYRGRWAAAALVVATGVGGLLAYGRAAASSFAAFSAGAGHFPILPGQPALLFVASMLIVGWGVGATTKSLRQEATVAQLGWFAIAVVLVPAALGRADYSHMFWNGLGAILLATALLWTVSRGVARGYQLLVAMVFCVCLTTAVLVWGGPVAFDTGVKSGAITWAGAQKIAWALGRSNVTGAKWWNQSRRREPSDEDISWLADQRSSVLAPYFLVGSAGPELARRQALVPMFEVPSAMVVSQSMVDRNLQGLATAKYVLMPRADYESFIDQAAQHTGQPSFGVQGQPTSPEWYGLLMQYPLRVVGTRPVMAVGLEFARALERDWRVDRHSGDYVVLRRKSARD
jgi:hypothetical protein